MSSDNQIKVAIADDHSVFKQGIETVLSYSPGFNLMLKANNGADLLEKLKDNQPDVRLLDLRMPVMDGLTTLVELRKHYPMIKVVILSMNLDTSIIKEAIKLGANGHLLKTADPDTILNTLRECNRLDNFVSLVA